MFERQLNHLLYGKNGLLSRNVGIGLCLNIMVRVRVTGGDIIEKRRRRRRDLQVL